MNQSKRIQDALVTMDYKTAMAAGQDAGDRNMRAAGRTVWNDEDFRIAAELVAKLLGRPTESMTDPHVFVPGDWVRITDPGVFRSRITQDMPDLVGELIRVRGDGLMDIRASNGAQVTVKDWQVEKL